MPAKKQTPVKTPSVIVKPLGKTGGLDSIHLALSILVVVMVALLLAVSYSKQSASYSFKNPPLNNSNATCSYGIINGTCVVPVHNSTQIKMIAERFIARYNTINTSLSLLPYISEVGLMNLSYDSASHYWYVSFPIQNLESRSTIRFLFMINDSNTSKVIPMIQTIAPSNSTVSENFVASKGVVQISGKSSCSSQVPLQLYWFVDPYEPGGISSLANMTSIQSKYGSKVGVSLEILYSQYSQNIASSEGLNNTLSLGDYLFCSSKQGGQPFYSFVNTLEKSYQGGYMPASLLSEYASSSGLNSSEMGSCLGTAGTYINRQAVLAKYYGIVSSPAVVTDCQYLSLPQTASYAISYANSSI